jgi:hypothetical protein
MGMRILCFSTQSTAIWSSLPSRAATFFPSSLTSSFPAPSPTPQSCSVWYSMPTATLKDGNFEVTCLFQVASDGPTFISTYQLRIVVDLCSTVLIGKPRVVDGFIFSARFIAAQWFSGQLSGGSLRLSGRLIVQRFVLKCRRWLVFTVLS